MSIFPTCGVPAIVTVPVRSWLGERSGKNPHDAISANAAARGRDRFIPMSLLGDESVPRFARTETPPLGEMMRIHLYSNTV